MLHVPERFKNALYTDFKENSDIRAVLQDYLVNLEEYYLNGMAPIFMGASGVGKSRASATILNAIDAGTKGFVSTAWVPVSETLNLLLDARDMKNVALYTHLYRSMKETEFIVMDDFTTLRDSPRLKEYFWMIIEHRYTEKRPTIFTANFHLKNSENIVYDIWRNIETHFGSPFARRLEEIGKGLTLIL